MPVSTNKYVGFVASLLTIFSLIYSFVTILQIAFPSATTAPFSIATGLFLAPLGIIGFILFLVAMYGFSKDYHADAIFNYVLYGFIAAIVIGALVVAVAFFFLFSSLASTLFSNTPPGSGASQVLQNFSEDFLPIYLIGSFVGLIPAFFNMLAFRKLGNKSGVRLFRTVGLLGVIASAVGIAFWFVVAALYYTGAITIYNIFASSVASSIVSLIAWVLAAKAFYSVNVVTVRTQATPSTQSQVPSTGQTKYCPNCGAANALDAEFCVRCGTKQ